MKKSHPKAYARALYEATLNQGGAALEKVIKNFVALLARDRQLKKSGLIIEEFVHYAKGQEGIMEIEIHSARELAAATLSHVKKAFGENVEAISVVDETLLGGVVVRTKDKILDGSLRKQLSLLKIRLST